MDAIEQSYESLMKYCDSRNIHPKEALKAMTETLISAPTAEQIKFLLVERQDAHGWVM